MIRKIRIAVLLYLLLFVATNDWLSRYRNTDWDETLWVSVYPINGDGSPVVSDYLARLGSDEVTGIAKFFQRETARYGLNIDEPVRVALGPHVTELPPSPPRAGNPLKVAWWSLRFRYWAWRATRHDEAPSPDVSVFAVYFAPSDGRRLEPSLGLAKGMLGLVNAFAAEHLRGTNAVIIAHEVLHTLGASDKYDPATSLPLFPSGYGEPDKKPLFPQTRTEIMGGRRSLSLTEAATPESLKDVVIGRETAAEVRLAPL